MHRPTAFCVCAFLAAIGTAMAAEPIRIGLNAPLSGRVADRGQSEQDGAELAVTQINGAGGILGRPLQASYADNRCDPQGGIQAAQQLIQDFRVSVMIGAMCTPVTLAIMPVVQQARIPLLIDVSSTEKFVEAAGVGGNDYVFKINPSDRELADGFVGTLKGPVHKVAVVSDDNAFARGNAAHFAAAAKQAGMDVVATEVVPAQADFAAIVARLKQAGPEQILIGGIGADIAGLAHALQQANWNVPVAGRYDLAAAVAAAPGAFEGTTIATYSPLFDTPQNKAFVEAFRTRFSHLPNQRAFYAYEAVLVAADAIRRAGSDDPASITAALKAGGPTSILGGTYAVDDHNHAHNQALLLGLQQGKVAVVGHYGT